MKQVTKLKKTQNKKTYVKGKQTNHQHIRTKPKQKQKKTQKV